MAEKVVLITEQSNPIQVVDKDNYILEGIFAVFGKENVNHRIYDEKEYMPHLEYLQEKIARHKLAGELDHPEKFDISLANISHLVEKLWYDKDTRTLRGRIRILDTEPAGMNARKLVNAGFPISISSRAAGVVKDDKHVEIKRIFTYDLVADGGFGNEAELERVKESIDNYSDSSKALYEQVKYSVDNSSDEIKAIFESASKEPELKCFKTNFENIKVYDVTDKYGYMLNESDENWSKFDFDTSEDTLQKDEINNKNNESEMADNVTIDDMAKYSRYVKEQFENLQNEVNQLKEGKSGNGDVDLSSIQEKIDQLNNATKALDEKYEQMSKYLNDFVNEHNALSKKFDVFERHSNDFVKEHNDLVRYTEAIANENEQIKGYLNEEVKRTVESSIKYSEYIKDNLEECVHYLDEEVAYNINKQQQYLDEVVAENVNNILKYQDYLAEKANEVYAYADYLGENVASKEELENAIGYTEYVAEQVESNYDKKQKVNENESLDSKIDAILENVKITRASKLLEMSKYPYLSNFNSEQLKAFNALNEAQKEMVSKNIAVSTSVDTVLNEAAQFVNDDKWITDMPAEYVSAWNSLNENEKAAIKAQAQLYDLNSAYRIKNFWQTRGLEEKVAQPLNESKQVVDLGGYDSNFIEQVRKGLKKFDK